MAPKATTPCATCGKLSKFACTECSVTRYCTPECRDKDLFQHKDQCLSLLQMLIGRIGKTLREIFYVFSERAYTYNVSTIAKGVDALMVSQAPNQVGRVLFEFPAQLLQSLQDRRAVLCMRRSEDAVGYLHCFISQMLKGVPLAKVEEVSAVMRPAPRAGLLSYADHDGNRCLQDPGEHRFLKLVASSHVKRWTLDPAGAMYGIHTESMGTSNHDLSYVQRASSPSLEFGAHERKLQKFANVAGLTGLRYKVLFIARDYLQAGVDEWILQSGLTLSEMLRTSDDDFQVQLSLLRTCVHGSMSSLTTGNEYRNAIREVLGT